jgi:tetratricopeptide (TPR) repeat protein
LLQAGRATEAAEVLDAGLSLGPQEQYAALVPYLLKNRGLAARKLGDDDAAFVYWTQGVEKDPTIVELHRLMAEGYERLGRTAEARAHWAKVAQSQVEEERRIGLEALERLSSR